MGRTRKSTLPVVDAPAGFKQCTMCGSVKSIDEFHKWSRSVDGRTQQCAVCRSQYKHAASTKAWKARNQDRVRQHAIKYKQHNRTKMRARQAILNRVHRGTLVRPTTCSKCGTVAATEAHHHDYSKPLDVQWLCKSCHSALSKKARDCNALER